MLQPASVNHLETVPRWNYLLCGLFVLVAFLFRVYWIPAGEYRYDDVALGLLSQLQASGEFQLFGMQSSNGGLNFPASVYFLAGLFTLTPDYYGVMVLIVAFNSLGMLLLWLIARSLFDARVALIAVFLMAVSVWATQYSRRLWAQEFNGPFLIGGFLLSIWGYVDGRRWAQLLALPVLLFGMQIHFAAFALFPVFLYIVWSGRKNIDWHLTVGSLLLSALLTAPFIYGIVTGQTDAPNILERFTTQSATTAESLSQTVNTDPFYGLLNIIGGTGLDVYYFFSPDELTSSRFLLVPAMILWASVLIGVVAGLRRRKWVTILFLIWVLVPVLVMVTGVVGAPMFYFIMLLPPLLMLSAFGFVTAAQLLPKLTSVIVLTTLLGGVGIIQVMYMQQFFERVITVGGFAYTTPVGFLLNARSQLPPPNDLIMIGTRYLISEGDIWSMMLYRRTECVRELAMDGGVDLVILPAQPYTVMYSAEAEPNSLYVNDSPTEIPLRAGDQPYRYYQFDVPPQPAILAEIVPLADATFAGGLTLQGYAMFEGRIVLDYRVSDIAADGDDLKFFVHLLDMNGERLGQFDAPFYPRVHWCANDRYLLSFDARLTTTDMRDVATLRIGMYRQRRENIIGLDAFSAIGERFPWVDIPLERS